MRVLGYTDNAISNDFYFIDLCTTCLYHGVDWIYTTVETVTVYDVKFWYFWFLNMIFQDYYNFSYNIYLLSQSLTSYYQIFAAITLDNYFNILNNKLPYNDEWFRSYLASVDSTSTLYYYPELLNVINFSTIEFMLIPTTYLKNSIQYLLDSETLLTAVMLFPQYLFCLFLAAVTFVFYFNYYSTSTKEESIVDHDYLIANSTLDAEEEIGSLDDILLGFLIFFYVFAWFFYIYFWAVLTLLPELSIVFWLFPFIYLIILLMPLSLLYDFGIYFLGYLRGVGTTPIFLSEILFDYIAIFAFFIRLVVQGVRLLLMFFVYASFHDLILYWSWDSRWFYGSESFWQDISTLDLTVSSITYFFFFKLPNVLVYLIYELLHTFFVVTAQFFAFIGMVFWLFFFLYTFFTFEPQESYLSFKRGIEKVKTFFYSDLK